eukprot:scaffold1207_cov25-Tisochrysis_lutea.AAC.1
MIVHASSSRIRHSRQDCGGSRCQNKRRWRAWVCLFAPSLARSTEGLPVEVAADDDVAAEDRGGGHVIADEMGDDGGSHGELNRRGVDDADDVARARRVEDAEKGAVEAILCVELDHLLVVVRALEELNARVERAAVGLDEDLDRVDRWVEGVGAEGAALDNHGAVEDIGRRLVDAVCTHVGREGKLELPDVADSDGVGPARCLDHRVERAQGPVLVVDAHLDGRVVGAVPELDVGIQRSSLGDELDLDLLDSGRAVGPGAKGPSLNEDAGVGLRDWRSKAVRVAGGKVGRA